MSINLFPAIDLLDGKCVRLKNGDFDQKTVFSENPAQQAKKFADMGFKNLHIVDLDSARAMGSKKEVNNLKTIAEISSAVPELSIQVGGGLRSLERVEEVLSYGVDRVILGTICVTNSDLVTEIIEKFPSKVLIGLDTKGDNIATHGWTETSPILPKDLIEIYNEQQISGFIYTDISKDGILEGCNFEKTEELNKLSSHNLIASGGVSSIYDLVRLDSIGMYGAILGISLYSGAIKVKEITDFLNA